MKTDCELIEDFWVSQGGKPHMAADLWFYESSWDMIMPVVDKIDQLYRKVFPSNEEFVRRILAKENPLDGPYMDVVGLPISTPISEVCQALVKFIKWYNENQKGLTPTL